MDKDKVFDILGRTCLSPDKWTAYEQAKLVIFHDFHPMPFEYEMVVGFICEFLGI